jgi:hypothetical protein
LEGWINRNNKMDFFDRLVKDLVATHARKITLRAARGCEVLGCQ